MNVVHVGYQSDSVDSLRKQYDIGEPQLDFIQQTLRRLGMQCTLPERMPITAKIDVADRRHPRRRGRTPADGAAVACGSTLQNKVVDAALRYIIHRVFGGPDRSGGHSFSRDAFFVPSGWDTPAKVALLSEGAVAADGRRLGTGYPEGTPFNDVILPPAVDQVRQFTCRLRVEELAESSQEQGEGDSCDAVQGNRPNTIVAALDDQAFLESLQGAAGVRPGLWASHRYSHPVLTCDAFAQSL